MKFTFQSKTVADCKDYLQVIYNNQIYSLENFSNKFKKGEFQLETLLPNCVFVYKGKEISFNDYKQNILTLNNSLPISKIYHERVYSQEVHLSICNFEFYKAAKFLDKAETCLQTARYYLIKSANILEYDSILPWKYGYQLIFDMRVMNFTTSIIWYNNCYDYILQIAFLAFELYKYMPKYKETMSFEDVLKLCTYNNISTLYEKNKDKACLEELWILLNNCHTEISEINMWANFAKHKGGIGVVGQKPDNPIQIYIGKPGEKPESRTSEFESIKLDMDLSIEKIINAHNALFNCISKLVDFIAFENAHYSINDKGEFIIPEKETYSKIVLN